MEGNVDDSLEHLVSQELTVGRCRGGCFGFDAEFDMDGSSLLAERIFTKGLGNNWMIINSNFHIPSQNFF